MSSVYPQISCDNQIIGGATHEIHIFLGPFNPVERKITHYKNAVEEWNTVKHPEELTLLKSSQMKACQLSLEFLDNYADGSGPVGFKNVIVMQSARYVYENDMQRGIEVARRDAAWFDLMGFEVIRLKIEASAYGNKGIPQTDEEAKELPDCYFEFHVKVLGEGATVDDLRSLAEQFSKEYKVPVPFSHNLNPNQFLADQQGHQLYFNMRFRLAGLQTAKLAIKHLEETIDAQENIKLHKVISEYVWYDTNVSFDKGWLE